MKSVVFQTIGQRLQEHTKGWLRILCTFVYYFAIPKKEEKTVMLLNTSKSACRKRMNECAREGRTGKRKESPQNPKPATLLHSVSLWLTWNGVLLLGLSERAEVTNSIWGINLDLEMPCKK